jgi:hypothetical protein
LPEPSKFTPTFEDVELASTFDSICNIMYASVSPLTGFIQSDLIANRIRAVSSTRLPQKMGRLSQAAARIRFEF